MEKVFVTDAGNNRVQVLNADLSYSHCKGARPGEFNDPHGITIDAEGMVYVADFNNRRIQKFIPERLSSKQWRRRNRLNRPHGLCVDGSGILYVTNFSVTMHTVSMFTSNGRFLGYNYR